MSDYKLFWGDSHTNIHSANLADESYVQTILDFARQMLDFWPLAYYPQETCKRTGFVVEDRLDEQTADADWNTICKLATENNTPGELVIFAGYEWQGDGRSGDHNVFYLDDYPPLIQVNTLPELYGELKKRALRALVIPHHTAYLVGIRGKNWDVHDELLSPFAEIYSVHGCSESDEEWIGLRHNRRMGPGVSGGTIEEALERGYKLGIICSGDNHYSPAVYGNGLMACYAKELTRESLWEAFTARRVYGVSADRIELHFTVDDAIMGSSIQKAGPVRIEIKVRGSNAIDRIELLRNNRVIGAYVHTGQWEVPKGQERVRCKLRIEAGWGPTRTEIPERATRQWNCSIEVPNGVITSVEKCWRSPGQYVDAPDGHKCAFGFHTPGWTDEAEWGFHALDRITQATIFELEARPSDEVKLNIDGKSISLTLAEAMRRSRVVFFPEEVKDYLKKKYHIDPKTLPHDDPLYFLSHKAKLHRAIPEGGYTTEFQYRDEAPPAGTNFYRVRVYQRNGSIAWSSPVWVENTQ